jgi:hypothetical protein
LTNATINEDRNNYVIDLGNNPILDIPNLLIDVDIENSVANWSYFDVLDPFYLDEGQKNRIYPHGGQNFAITLYCTIEKSPNESYEILFMGVQQTN